MKQVRVVSITAAGTTKAWAFAIGVFQGSSLAPRIYFYQEQCFSAAQGPLETGIPPIRVGKITVNLAPERYSDDEVVLAGGVRPLLKILRTQEHHAPRWRVDYVQEKEEYLILKHTSYGQLR